MASFESGDIIAILTILGCFFLIYMGKNGNIYMVLTGITSYYFGRKASRR